MGLEPLCPLAGPLLPRVAVHSGAPADGRVWPRPGLGPALAESHGCTAPLGSSRLLPGLKGACGFVQSKTKIHFS